MTHCTIYIPEVFRKDVSLLFTNGKHKIIELMKKELSEFNIFNVGIYLMLK